MTSQVSFDNLTPFWDRAYGKNSLQVPFLTWAWHDNWQKVFGQSYTPFYLSVDDAIVAPFVRQGNEVTFSGGEEIADYLDLIGPDEQKEKAWREIIEFLKSQGVQSLSLRNVPQSSPTIGFFNQLQGSMVSKEDTTPYISLPDKWETYVESLPYKERHELERKIRKFDREHTRVAFVASKNPAGDIDVLLSLMKHDEKKKAFLSPWMETFFKTTARTFASGISLLMVTVEREPVSATLSFVSKGTYYLYNSGFDRIAHKNAGFYLKAKSIKYAIERKLRTYNFLQGNERYKFDLGARDFFVYKITYSLK